MTNMLEEGSKLPEFSVASVKGSSEKMEILDSKQLIGKTSVIYFYPKDNTPGCSTEAQDFAAISADFQNLDCVIIGVSRDDVKSHCAFMKKFDLPFILAADETGEICEKFGVWKEKSMYGKKFMGIERSTFLIDENGIIQKIWRKVSVTNHAQNVLQHLQKLQSEKV